MPGEESKIIFSLQDEGGGKKKKILKLNATSGLPMSHWQTEQLKFISWFQL